MKKKKIYKGVKGERITVVEKQNKRSKNKLHAQAYEENKKKDKRDAVIFLVLVALIIVYVMNGYK